MKKEKLSVKELCATAVFTALTAVCAQISIPLPFTPVPISFGIIGLYLAAILLPPRCAIMSQICYLLLGAAGIPVFASFRGGIAALFGPTGGYLFVYPIMAAIVSITLNSRKAMLLEADRHSFRVSAKGAISICTAHLALYLCGTLWLSYTTDNTFVAGLSLAVFPYIPIDIAKIVFCVAAIIPLRRRFSGIGLLSFPASQMNEAE